MPDGSSNSIRILVTGGAGYVGATLVEELLQSGDDVRVLDALIHDQADVASRLEGLGAEVIVGDIRDEDTRRRALAGSSAVVHLAAIVGDPACTRDPETSREVNVEATRELIADAERARVERFVFASTCSNYGRMEDPTVPIDEDGELRPISLYAEQKVEVERALLGGTFETVVPTCLRFATVYGVGPRMRFDLTVNEFTRDLWAGRTLKVFGEQFWRPYVHVRDAAHAAHLALRAPTHTVARSVFNVGNTDENYRKLDLVEEVKRQLGRGNVEFVHRDEDPRDYKVSFERIRRKLGFDASRRVPAGIAEVLLALEARQFGDPFDGRHRNTPEV